MIKKILSLSIIALIVPFLVQGQNVGVDVASPLQKLDVAGGLKIGNTTAGVAGSLRWTGTSFEVHDGTQWITFGAGTDNDWTVSGINMYSGVNGNVGIGTSTPATKLQVVGTAWVGELNVNGAYTLPTVDGGLGFVLSTDGAGTVTWIDVTEVGDITSVIAGTGLINGGTSGDVTLNAVGANGLNATADDIRLGGTLIQNTTVAQGNFNMTYDLNGTGDLQVIDGATPIMTVTDAGNVGIGTATPTALLQVHSTTGSPVAAIRTGSGASEATLSLENTGDNNNAWALKRQEDGDFAIERSTGGTAGSGTVTERMIIQPDGNVGIGGSAASSKLHVSGKLRIEDGSQGANKVLLSDVNGEGTWTNSTALSITEDQALSLSGTELTISEGNTVNLQPLQQQLIDGTANDDDTWVRVAQDNGSDNDVIRMATQSTERMRINQAGLVGVGTAVPITDLHVESSTGAQLRVSRIGSPTAGSTIGEIQFDSENAPSTVDASAVVRAIASVDHVGTDKGAHMAFLTKRDIANESEVAAERMRITAAGNVGIGTTTPDQKLHVTGNARLTDLSGTDNRALYANPTGVFTTTGPSTGTVGFWNRSASGILSPTTTTDDLRINGGDIDMVKGQSSQIHSLGMLSFDWTTAGTYDSPNNHGITSKNEAGAFSDNLRINSFNDIINTLDANNNNPTSYFKVQEHSTGDGTDLFWVRSSNGNAYLRGNVGVGITAPTAKLHVSSGDASYALFGPNSTWNSYLYVGAGTNTISSGRAQVISTNGNLHLDAGTGQNMYLAFYNGSNTFINAGAGNVGIGTTGPGYKLHVAGNERVTAGMYMDYVNNGTLAIGGSSIGSSDAVLYVENQSNADWGIIVNKGAFDYGTDIRVNNTASYALRILGSGTQRFRVRGDGVSYQPFIYDNDDTNYYLDPNGTSSMNLITSRTRATMGNSALYNTPRHQNTSDTRYWTGSMGWGTTDLNNVANWGSGFIDSWGSPGNGPGTSTHYVGHQAFHFAGGGTYNYGYQMVSSTNQNRWHLRSNWNSGWSPWVEMVHTGNIGTFTSSAGHIVNSGSGDWQIASNSASTSYSRSSLELRETNFAGAAQQPPRLGFHWGGVVASQISIENNGRISIRNNPGSGYESLIAQNLYSNAEVYLNNWVRHADNDGTYWSNTAWHIYPRNAQDMYLRTGNGNGGIAGTIGNTTPRGYIHWTTNNEIGFLNAGRGWSLRVDNAGNSFHTASSRAPIFYDSQNTGYYWDGTGNSRLAGVTRSDNGFNVDGNTVIDNGAGWHRSYGGTGWYNGSYGGGTYMVDATWVRVYNSKGLVFGQGAYSNGSSWGGYQTSNSTSDGHRFNPATGNWGYIGLSNQYWYYMYSNNFINISKRESKRDITPLDDNQMAYVMQDIEKMKPSFYKYKAESDEMVQGFESKYRANMHLGVILDETPDYLQDQAFSGIDVYSMGVMALTGVKYQQKQIKELKKQVNSNMAVGKASMTSNVLIVELPNGFCLDGEIPVINITPTGPNTGYYLSSTDSKSFSVTGNSPFAFNWQAVRINSDENNIEVKPTIDSKLASQLVVDQSKKDLIKAYWDKEKVKTDGYYQEMLQGVKTDDPVQYERLMEENRLGEAFMRTSGKSGGYDPAAMQRKSDENATRRMEEMNKGNIDTPIAEKPSLNPVSTIEPVPVIEPAPADDKNSGTYNLDANSPKSQPVMRQD